MDFIAGAYMKLGKNNNHYLTNLAHILVRRYPLKSAAELTIEFCSMIEEQDISSSDARSLIDDAILNFDDTEAAKQARIKSIYPSSSIEL
jgi:hypothetical protein